MDQSKIATQNINITKNQGKTTMAWMSILTRKILIKNKTIISKLIIKISANGYDEAMKQIKQDPLLQQGWKIYTIIKNVYRP